MSPNTSKPAVILVPGAWHTSSHYADLKKALETRGFPVTVVALATSGESQEIKGKSWVDDVERIHEAFNEPLRKGEDIIVIAHSYGGIPATVSVDGYQLHERQAKGLKGGVARVIYMTSFALPTKNMNLKMACGGEYTDFMDRTSDDVLTLNDKAMHAFYHDLDPEVAKVARKNTRLQATRSFEVDVPFVATDVEVPRTYVVCENDQAIPAEGQMAWAEAMGSGVTIEKIPSGHSPFLNDQLPKLVDIIERSAS